MTAGRNIVLLDLDGTLTQSHPGILASVKYACRVLHLPVPSDKELGSFIGPPIIESMERNGVVGDDLTRAVAAYRQAYASPTFPDPHDSTKKIPGMFLNSVYDGIPEALRHMRDDGYVLAVATAKPQPQADPVCEYFGLTPLVDAVFGASLDTSRMHKADVIRYALDTLDFSPNDGGDKVVMVGDRWTDVDGAREDGIDTLGVRWGYAEEGELEKHGVVSVVDETTNLPHAINGYFSILR